MLARLGAATVGCADPFTTAAHAEQPGGWTIGCGDPGKAADVRPVRAAADHPITREAVAAYLAKYATKSTEATGHLSTRITPATIDTYADDTHAGRLIEAAWTLGLDEEHRGLRRRVQRLPRFPQRCPGCLHRLT